MTISNSDTVNVKEIYHAGAIGKLYTSILNCKYY
jgi:hypothetical protein